MQDRNEGRPLFWAILMPQFLMLALILVALAVSIPASGLGDQIVRNYQKVVSLQTANRGEYLSNYLVDNRIQLSGFTEDLTDILQSKIDDGAITLEQLSGDRRCYAPLLREVSDELLSILYAYHAGGAFVILNTDAGCNEGAEMPSLHFYNSNAISMRRNPEDVRVLCAPMEIRRDLGLMVSGDCQFSFVFEDEQEQAYFYEPFLHAYRAGVPALGERYGYWSVRSYEVNGKEVSALTYSEPLILKNGTVVGVAGIELLVEDLLHYMPAGELLENGDSAFLLALSANGSHDAMNLIINGGTHILNGDTGATVALSTMEIGGYSLVDNGEAYYADSYKMDLYSDESVRSGQVWYLIGIVRMGDMFVYADKMTEVVMLVGVLVLLIGLVSGVMVSRRLSKPIKVLAAEVENARITEHEEIVFTDTGIAEIDSLSASYRKLMKETVDTSTKFLRIMDLASVELAGYEWREDSENVYVTDNFFPMFGMENIDTSSLTSDRLQELLEEIRSKMGGSITLDGSRIYCINHGGNVRYVRAESSQDGDRHVGLLEDVTRSTLERIRVEHERDYDVLTGLYNRRAFYARVGELFSLPDELRYAALLVMDMDKLKMINDRFGHDWGDKYLRQTAQTMLDNTADNALCARISGDEFYIFFWGYDSREALYDAINGLMDSIFAATIRLPGDELMNLSLSAGVAEYPANGNRLQELVKYADFAMYQAKQAGRGTIMEFDAVEYAKNEAFQRGRGELKTLIAQESMNYHFQPIFSAVTARPAAYEALMRVNMPSIKSPDMVLRLAAAEGSQYHIERLTMFKATEAYQNLLAQGQVDDEAMLFVNSLPDQCLTDEDAQRYHERFADLQSRIVIEITEDEYLGLEALEVKRKYPGFSGNFALDDYGSGYNGEKNLLLLQPRFVKVDVVFIRGIDTNPDRQQLVSSLVTYAHGRDMQVVAEGIETAEELQKVLELGVDLLQGYFLARPAAIPSQIAPQAEEIIRKFKRS